MEIKTGNTWKVVSEKTGRNLGSGYKSKAEADNRLRQVEYFKHKKSFANKYKAP